MDWPPFCAALFGKPRPFRSAARELSLPDGIFRVQTLEFGRTALQTTGPRPAGPVAAGKRALAF